MDLDNMTHPDTPIGDRFASKLLEERDVDARKREGMFKQDLVKWIKKNYVFSFLNYTSTKGRL